MSDKLNEKFEELVTAQKVIVEDDQSKMPTVQATVIPGTGSEPSQVSDAQTAKSTAAGDQGTQPKVDASQSYGQSAPSDLGGSSTTPNESD